MNMEMAKIDENKTKMKDEDEALLDALSEARVVSIARDALGMAEEREAITEDCGALNEASVIMPKSFELGNLDISSKKTIDAHIALYNEYIQKANRSSLELDAFLDDQNIDLDKYRDAQLRFQHYCSATHLHELFFENLGHSQNSSLNMDSLAYIRLQENFKGNFDLWQKSFLKLCESVKVDSWVICGLNLHSKKIENIIIEGHNYQGLVGFFPLVVLDLWTHAYFKDYGNDKKAWAHNFLLSIRWNVVERRAEQADKILKTFKHY